MSFDAQFLEGQLEVVELDVTAVVLLQLVETRSDLLILVQSDLVDVRVGIGLGHSHLLHLFLGSVRSRLLSLHHLAVLVPQSVLNWLVLHVDLSQVESLAESGNALVEVAAIEQSVGSPDDTELEDGRVRLREVLAHSLYEVLVVLIAVLSSLLLLAGASGLVTSDCRDEGAVLGLLVLHEDVGESLLDVSSLEDSGPPSLRILLLELLKDLAKDELLQFSVVSLGSDCITESGLPSTNSHDE